MPGLNTTLTGRLNAFFNLKNFVDVLTSLPKPQTPMTDLLFPQSKRKQKTSPYIAVADVKSETGAVPVIMRGTRSYPVDQGTKKAELIEVQPLTMSKFISGADLNNLIALGDVDNINAKLTEVTENLRDRTAVSTEVLVCQALSGTIEYPVSLEGGGTDKYVVEIGGPVAMSATNLRPNTVTLGNLQKALEEQFVEQQKTGCSSDVRFLTGSNVYSRIIALTTTAPGNVPVQWTDYGCILFGKYKIMPTSATYTLPGKTTTTAVIDADSIQSIDLANTGKMFYAALDELDAKLRPLPFFATHISSKDPSGVKVLSSSKPLPAFAVSKSVIRKYL